MDSTALEQAAADIMKAAGDVPAPEQGGQDAFSVKVADQEKGAPQDNKEAKAKRLSDAAWQAQQEESQKKEKELEELKKGLDEVKKALTKAPDEVQKEDDLATKVEKLTEINQRKDWELDHPIVRTPKYAEQWKKVCEENIDLIKTGRMSYEKLWKMIKDEPAPRYTEDLKEDHGSIPPASKGTVSSSSEVDTLAAEMLKAAGIGQKDKPRII